MAGQHPLDQTPIRLTKLRNLLLLFWTACILFSTLLYTHQENVATTIHALTDARVAYDKDMVYRRWNSLHGGVYAPVTPQTQPNPYLHIEDRDVTTQKGRRLTLINHAYMSRQVYELTDPQKGILGHLTSLNPLRPENNPDPWEKAALDRLNAGAEEVYSLEEINGEEYMRLMRPLFVEASCLKCHADQGYDVGDLRGGISVAVRMSDLRALARQHIINGFMGHLLLWLLGITGIVIGVNRLDRQIVRRLEAEEDRSKLERQLLTAQKMEAIGTLAGGIAHDFNNILGAVIGYTDLALLKSNPENREVHRFLQEILKAGDRAKELVHQILHFSRQTASKPRPMEITPIVKEIVKLLGSSLPSTITVRADIQDSGAKILADATHIHQAIINLCTNAAQAMEEGGGTLSITVRKAKTADLPDQAGDSLMIEVADTGPGISSEVHHQIFEPLFTTKEEQAGTGLGLSVVRTIVENYGGTIKVDSKPGQGATFRLFFPIVTDGKHSRETEVLALDLPRGQETIMLVDDEESLIRIGTQMLEFLGYKVIGKTDSVEALAHIQNNPSCVDLLLCDQVMPDLSGTELIDKIRKVNPTLPVLLCTGYSTTNLTDELGRLGINEVLSKPLSIRTLAVSIRRALDNRSRPAAG